MLGAYQQRLAGRSKNNDAVNVIWHHDEGVSVRRREVLRDLSPSRADYVADGGIFE